MIGGASRLESDRFPFLPVTFTVEDATVRVEAILDTGFDGDLALPARLVPARPESDLSLRFRLADGTRVRMPSYSGVARLGELDLLPATIVVTGDEPIIGRGLIVRYAVLLDRGARVVVEA